MPKCDMCDKRITGIEELENEGLCSNCTLIYGGWILAGGEITTWW